MGLGRQDCANARRGGGSDGFYRSRPGRRTGKRTGRIKGVVIITGGLSPNSSTSRTRAFAGHRIVERIKPKGGAGGERAKGRESLDATHAGPE